MKRHTWVTAVVLGAVVVLILAALMREARRNPTFRAEDYPTLRECVRNIPPEWRPGSLERQGAEAACHYAQQRRLPVGS